MSVPHSSDLGGRWAKVPDWVFTLGLTPSEFAVYAALCLHVDAAGRAWPGQATLAELTGLSERWVRASLTRFREMGLVEAVRSGRRNGPLVYQLSDSPPPLTGTPVPEPQFRSSTVDRNPSSGATGTPVPEQPEPQFRSYREQPIEQLNEHGARPAREAPPDLPASGSAAPEDDQPVSTPERDARRTPPLPAGTATRQSATLWVTPRDWRPAPEFNPAVTQRGLAAARATLKAAQAARPVPPSSPEAEE